MRKRKLEDLFKEITCPVELVWKEAKRSDKNGNIYVVRKTGKGQETVHVRR